MKEEIKTVCREREGERERTQRLIFTIIHLYMYRVYEVLKGIGFRNVHTYVFCIVYPNCGSQ